MVSSAVYHDGRHIHLKSAFHVGGHYHEEISYSEGGEYDRRRNLVYSNKGTYGTAGFMSRKELTEVLDLVPDIRKHSGTILGELDHQVICIPPKTRFNGNLAVYGASGSKKTRAFCVNMILQAAARKSSLIICDPKSELYEKTSEYLRDQGLHRPRVQSGHTVSL